MRRPLSYLEYMASPDWQLRREAYFEKFENTCMGCNFGGGSQLHHITYERMGHELDEDLVPLCEECHAKVHRHTQTSEFKNSSKAEAIAFSTSWLIGSRTPRRRIGLHKLGQPLFAISTSKRHVGTDRRCPGCGWWLLSTEDKSGYLPCGRCYDLRARGILSGLYKQDHPSQRKAVP